MADGLSRVVRINDENGVGYHQNTGASTNRLPPSRSFEGFGFAQPHLLAMTGLVIWWRVR